MFQRAAEQLTREGRHGPSPSHHCCPGSSLYKWVHHAGARKEPLKPPPEASDLLPGTHGVDTLPAVVIAMLVLYVVPVTYCNCPHRVLYLLHRLPAGLSLRGSGCVARMDPPHVTLLS